MKKLELITGVLILSILSTHAQIYHSVANFSYANEGLYAKVIKSNPTNAKIIYIGAQNVNSSYKGFFDTYDLTQLNSIKRTKRMGILTDSFGVTDFVFRGSDIFAIGSKGLQIISASVPSNPIFSRNIKTFKDGNNTSNFGYMTASIFIEGDKMHYGGFDYKLFDISNLNLLTKLTSKSYSGINSGSIKGIESNRVLVGDGYDLKIYDVSAAPKVTSTTLNFLYGNPKQMLYDDSKQILYTTFETASKNFIYSVNMTNNNKLDSFNYLSVAGFNPSSHSGMFLYKDTLYIGTSSGVALFDVSNSSKLQFIGKLRTGGTNAVFVNDEYLIANDSYNLRFYLRGPAPTTSQPTLKIVDINEILPTAKPSASSSESGEIKSSSYDNKLCPKYGFKLSNNNPSYNCVALVWWSLSTRTNSVDASGNFKQSTDPQPKFFTIQFKRQGDIYWTSEKRDNTGKNDYTISGLDACTKYEVRLITKCDNNEVSEPSNIVRFTTACNKPGNLTVENITKNSAKINSQRLTAAFTFPCASSSTKQIRIIEYKTNTSSWQEVVCNSGSPCILNALSSVTIYRVRARYKYGNNLYSNYTNEISFTTTN